ncbi:methylorcinaldehyde synthase [Metarhizium rileyi]|uniref:Methylorcinaldehyde synthase n=1 Tax=Metarhizium rileyi (strain RCEF 4871) TaxID=1649241 RepID=A0A166YG69_METRR|nr:methylorcinaldehyde synthase [Metarhizium rileyi RCEF 4871]
MANNERKTADSSMLLLFGSLALSFDASSLDHVYKTLTESRHSAWIVDTIRGLPDDCKTALTALPSLHQTTGQLAGKQLLQLGETFSSGRPLDTAFPLSNTLLIPLAVAAQLAQYTEFKRNESLEKNTSRVDYDDWLKPVPGVETLGLCTGMLGAFAVSSSNNMVEFQRHGAAAIRLGLLIGLAVDNLDIASGRGRYKSLSVAWNSTGGGKEDVAGVLADFDQAYISVYYDENRVTVTTCADTISDLIRRLQAAGHSVSEIGLHGRFHFEGNRSIMDDLIAFCNVHDSFQFSKASTSETSLAIPTRSNDSDASLLKDSAGLHVHALRSILVEPPRWFDAFSAATAAREDGNNTTQVVDFGPERSVPPSLASKISSLTAAGVSGALRPERRSGRTSLDNDIAVIGMSCKVPGADNLDEFWELLVSGQSQHREIGVGSGPGDRFCFDDGPFRTASDSNMKRKWFANLLDGHDQFDHRFFKKTARESASMDPQQRHMLQAAYQAVEQSGYFQAENMHGRAANNIGCFVGVCLSDYDNNVASHAANAFTATGNLQGFISGKVSHFFGWTGPGLTINTACSSSLVAVHQACQSILGGECEAALAGGSHLMTSAKWFQNLAAGSFLSPTGQCKPFDAKADGYCRGEGVGAVFLKKMSKAMADGDPILGVIAASGVQQNENCTPIFVPNVPSLGDLFTTVLGKARVKPSEISVVEAHGTGTAVGDPAEYDSIRTVLGGPNRGPGNQLMLSSVKGLVGHMECTSGVIGLIKVLLMMNRGTLPPQASFDTLSPSLGAKPTDQIYIPTRAKAWDVDFRAALLNNYGASGSNASAVILQAPSLDRAQLELRNAAVTVPVGLKCPFFVSGSDQKSLRRYVAAFRSYLSRSSKPVSLANLSFNLAHQSNRALDSRFICTARSVEDLDQTLSAFENTDTNTNINDVGSKEPAVVLCFGGQISSHVGLSRQLYDSVAILRRHLDHVNTVAQSLGCSSIFPGIFQRTPMADTVQLQVTLFATQYASARSWIDCGIKPAALLGHSFGELTALCVSQILSLEDTVKLIIRRATLVRDAWGPDKGAMMAIEADLGDVKQLLIESNGAHSERPATIACYNGPRSYTLAGSTVAIDAVATQLEARPQGQSTIKSKKLNVTNAFHSVLVDGIYDDLKRAAHGLRFRKPTIALEFATEKGTEGGKLTAQYVADHMRNPVRFHHAAERLAKQYLGSACVFLEAGANSTITSMASRALVDVKGATLSFHGVNIANCDDGWDKLTDTVVSLWKVGLPVQHWGHHAAQRRYQPDLQSLILPPYQFDPTSRHWMELRVPPKVQLPAEVGAGAADSNSQQPEGLLTFHGFQDGTTQKQALFRINTADKRYQKMLSGHVTMQTAPILSATLQIGFVIDAIGTVCPEYQATKLQPQIQDVRYHSPVCANSARKTWVEVTKGGDATDWRFEVFSTANKCKKQVHMVHTTGIILFSSSDNGSLKRELVRFERLFGHGRAIELLQSAQADEVFGNKTIYRIFSDIVDYGDEFRGMQKMAGRGNETAGHVVRLNSDPDVWFDAHLADTFCQLGGLWINCMQDRGRNHVYLANGIDQWMRLHPTDKRPREFDAFALHHRPSDQLSLTDVFVFDAETGNLVEAILGIAYVKISKGSMEKLLMRLSSGEPSPVISGAVESPAPTAVATMTQTSAASAEVYESTKHLASDVQQTSETASRSLTAKEPKIGNNTLLELALKVKAVIAELSGLEVAEINDESELADLGIDSLVGMEMVNDIESTLSVKLPYAEISVVTDMPGLMRCVFGAMGIDTNESSIEGVIDEDSDGADIISFGTSSDGGDGTGNISSSSSTAATESEIDKNEQREDAGELDLRFSTVMEAFREIKTGTDSRVDDMGQTHYVNSALPLENKLTVALVIEAFETLGAGFRDAHPGKRLSRIPHGKEHQRFVTYLYEMLEKETQIVKLDGDVITRTAVPLPQHHSKELRDQLLRDMPDQDSATKLTYYAGENLGRILSGETDGVKVIFGSNEGRELVSHWYAEWPLNRVLISQMEEFFACLSRKLLAMPEECRPSASRPLRILEMGAGTGGTTKRIVPLLAQLKVPVEYTFTDLAPSFVSAARKSLGKQYPWMKFRAHDIEKAPSQDLEATQHFIIASNAVHATRSLGVSTRNIRKALRRDGFLVMMEMTRTPYWVDLIFGLFEGWWLFEDGRQHALTHELRWEKELHAAGYGQVDWTEGERSETQIQKVIVAAANSANRCERSLRNIHRAGEQIARQYIGGASADCASREQLVTTYVRGLTQGFEDSILKSATATSISQVRPEAKCILITGGTGGLGAHLVAEAALRFDVKRVVCLNRPNKQQKARERQMQALHKRGIQLSPQKLAKIDVLEADLTQPTNLGVSDDDYESLLRDVTHIVHNAWLMHSKWPVKRFEPQLRIMANMLSLASNISARRPRNCLVTFEFVSSIATIGHHPIWTGSPVVLEERVPVESVLPTGYGEAKYICERMLDATLHRFPERFRAAAVRLGQIAGSSINGHWNPMEHVSFLLKSSQTIGALPDLPGSMGWTPADELAATLLEILTQPEDVALHPIYHIENPIRQPWSETMSVLASALVPEHATPLGIIAFEDWIDSVRKWPIREDNTAQGANPAYLLVDFLDTNFVRMSCGGLLMGTAKAREHSPTLAALGPVTDDLIRLYIKSWVDMGFLA